MVRRPVTKDRIKEPCTAACAGPPPRVHSRSPRGAATEEIIDQQSHRVVWQHLPLHPRRRRDPGPQARRPLRRRSCATPGGAHPISLDAGSKMWSGFPSRLHMSQNVLQTPPHADAAVALVRSQGCGNRISGVCGTRRCY